MGDLVLLCRVKMKNALILFPYFACIYCICIVAKVVRHINSSVSVY